MAMVILATLFSGHIDNMGPPIGSVVIDMRNTPWVSPLVGIPWQSQYIDHPDQEEWVTSMIEERDKWIEEANGDTS